VRPADANETALAWQFALEQTDGPCALVLSRQNLPILDPEAVPEDAISQGAYVLRREGRESGPEAILIGTGSEVALCLEAAELLEGQGVATRVVSMPCFDRFIEADESYRDEVLPPSCRARVSVEAGATFGWERWVTADGVSIGMHGFGASGPAKALYAHFGFTAENIASEARRVGDRLSAGTRS